MTQGKSVRDQYRVRKATKALAPYRDGDDTQSPVVDILTDLRHYCHYHGINFEDAAATSLDHFTTENMTTVGH
jgi:hypothetical protein